MHGASTHSRASNFLVQHTSVTQRPEPLRIGIIGMGRMGSHHADRILLREDCRLVSLCDTAAAAREQAAFTYDCPVCDEASLLLADPQVEVVFICTPPESHAALAVAALEAGKHAVVETPLCLSVAEGRAMIAAATQAGRMLTVAQMRRWDDHFRTAQAAAASGRLGTVQDLKLISWQHARDLVPDADALNHFAPHSFDQLLLLAGCAALDVYAVLADRADSATSQARGSGVAQGFLAVIRFESGLIAHVEVNRSSLAPVFTGWIISGSKAGYSECCLYTEDNGEIVQTSLPREPTDWEQFYTGLVRHLRHGERLHVTAEHALEVVRLIEATRRSAESGEVVRLAAIG
jgi:predicted dehydrogenase